jgi:molybdopterin-containing oxidoreductase family iron-sulfur binding subunit
VRGGVWTNAEPSRAFATADGRYRFVTAPIRAATEDKLKVDVEVEVDGNLDARFELDLHVYPSATLGDGRSAHVPFLLELQDPVTGARWTNLAEVAAEDARARGIDNGDTVEIASEAGSVTVTALVTEAVMPGVVAVAAGYGHRRYGRFATGRGVNAYSLLDARSDEDGFLVAGTKVSLRRVEGSV